MEWVLSIMDLMEPMSLWLCPAGLCPSWTGGEWGADLVLGCRQVQAPVDIPSPSICKNLCISIKMKRLQHSGKPAAWQSRNLALGRRQQQQQEPLLSPISHQRLHSLGLPSLGF